MKKMLAAAALVVVSLPAVATAQKPPQWTIHREVCWHVSFTEKPKCGVGLYGLFKSEQDCIKANNGVPSVKMPMRDAQEISQECKIALRGGF
jgi:hypothetical protein